MYRRQLHAPPPPPSGYVAIRNDAAILSIAERNLIRSTSTRNNNGTTRSMDHENLYLRVDGRKRTERRPIAIQLLRHDDPPTDASHSSSSSSSNSSSSHNATTATVTFGAGTRVTCTVTSELVAPVLDRPNDGILSVTMDISPGASTNYRNATPASTYHLGSSTTTTSTLPHAERHQKIMSNHILRTLERCLVQPGGAVDTEALCVAPGAYVWKIHVACTVLDDSGNVLDASVLAAMAALRHYRQPVVELVHATTPTAEPHAATTTVATPVIVPSHIKEPTPLPLLHTPFAISFIFIVNHNNNNNNGSTTAASSTTSGRKMGILLDPTNREEACQEGRLTIGMNVHREICFFDLTTGYQCQVQGSDLQYCSAVAESRVTEWSDLMESALSEADERDRTRRLVQWQQQQQQQLPLPPTTMVGPPPDFDPDARVDATTGITSNDDDDDEDFQYRRRALDFTMGHVASKIRENHHAVERKHSSKISQVVTVKSPHNNNNNNTLLASMLRSVQVGGTAIGEDTTETTTTELPILQNDDDEEEENVMELQSEFVTVPSAKKKRKR